MIIICSLKQNLSLAMLQKLIPMGISEEEVRSIYESFSERHNMAAKYFIEQVRLTAAAILTMKRRASLPPKTQTT